MKKSHDGGSRQAELFARSKRPMMAIEENHRLVQLADQLDWTELEELVQQIRLSALKNGAGRPPHLRPLIGSVLLMGTRAMSYREAEDQIRHYAPARYLCGLTESEWTPDFTTIQDFTQLMGEQGLRLINEHTVRMAVAQKLADPRLIVADTTAQEAAIPYPNEVGLMGAFLSTVMAASKSVGGVLSKFAKGVSSKVKAAKQKIRAHRLFAKTTEAKSRLTRELAGIVKDVQAHLVETLKSAGAQRERLTKYRRLAWDKVSALHETMGKLLPQIRYWLRTGRVATGKIVSIHIPELYSIVRGKAGKAVEFGLKWGITRLRGGFILATVAKDRHDLADTKFVLQAVDNHIALFGKAPHGYGYDRGGYSKPNVATLKEKGVKEVGLAPRGKAKWPVEGAAREELINERAQVEGCIGTIKSKRYGFNRPAARSAAMMGACGQRAVLGANLNKLVRELAKRSEMVLVG